MGHHRRVSREVKFIHSNQQLGSDVAFGNRSAQTGHQAAVLCCAANQRCSNCIGLRWPSAQCSLEWLQNAIQSMAAWRACSRVVNLWPWAQVVFKRPYRLSVGALPQQLPSSLWLRRGILKNLNRRSETTTRCMFSN